MKQFEVHDVTIGGYDFHIFPFPAFKATNIFANLTSVLSPIVPVLAFFVSSNDNFLDADIGKITDALGTLNGDKLEDILKRLLVREGNVTIEYNGDVEKLTEGRLNEIFCGSFDDLILLAVEVIKVNYKGFFEKLGLRFGGAGDQQETKTTT